MGQSPYGHKELEITEVTKHARTHTHTHTRNSSKMNVTTTPFLQVRNAGFKEKKMT